MGYLIVIIYMQDNDIFFFFNFYLSNPKPSQVILSYLDKLDYVWIKIIKLQCKNKEF